MRRGFGQPMRRGRRGAAWGLLLAWGAVSGLVVQAVGQERATDERLASLLAKAKAYCARLETAALDFTCLEKIQEKIYQIHELTPDTVVTGPAPAARANYSYAMPRQNYYATTYVYDYQFVRQAGRKAEQRVLVEKDGRKMKTDDAQLDTQTIRVENALFGPIGLVGGSAQPGHDYRISGEETDKGRKVVIVEAVPKPSIDRPHCFGRLWIREDDGSVLKISWDQTSVGNFQAIQAYGRKIGAEPELTSVTEYGQEKNGLRFPSQDTTEEAYVKHGKKYVQSLTTILYKDYRFFTVETEIRY
jgi:hypothetical protein